MTFLNFLVASMLILATSHHETQAPRKTVDFNSDWQFHLGNIRSPNDPEIQWQSVKIPHDWSIRESYRQENTAASTGFVPGGIGWYRKSFTLPKSDSSKVLWIEFDGVYCNSEVWINGTRLGFRPSGFSSFSYPLTEQLHFGGKPNVITVKVDHSAYSDARWYTGSGIYRNVRLIKTSPIHIAKWGVQITTPKVNTSFATINIKANVVDDQPGSTEVTVSIVDPQGKVIATNVATKTAGRYESIIPVTNPDLWGVDAPNLYTARTTVKHKGFVVDETESTFGIRTFEFDADHGFSLNGESMKIKGVNLHHDAGAVGAAVPKSIWESRVKKLKSIGVNAIRMSHNPHSVELMDVCDEIGMLVMDEFFDEWTVPKPKSIVFDADNANGEKDPTLGYSEHFNQWAERDLKDLILRDFNHPSVIMWSIGNEIEWTFPAYTKAFSVLNPDVVVHTDTPEFDPKKVKPVFHQVTQGIDPLATTAKQLSKWVKETDTTRPVTCGSVRPSIAVVSGYADAVDVLGFNYRAECYDIAHQTYPELKIIGSENWGAYSEWKNVKERDFVSGMFAWSGFAYLGESGHWPRKGLTISFFDFAGFKTPRGHFFECLWKPDPKVYLVTSPAEGSEYSYSEENGWKYEMQMSKPPTWSELRRWEWYDVNEHWNYDDGEAIIVGAYTNCDQAELFLNNVSLGKKSLASFPDDNIIKWLVPFQEGKLTVKGYRDGQVVHQYTLATTRELAKIRLSASKAVMKADGNDVAYVSVALLDAAGSEIRNSDTIIKFQVKGDANLLAVDNGWEMNVDSHYQTTVKTRHGRAVALIQSTDRKGKVKVIASAGDEFRSTLTIESN